LLQHDKWFLWPQSTPFLHSLWPLLAVVSASAIARDPGRHHDRSVRFAVRLGRLQADQRAVKWRLRLDHQGFLPRFAVLTPGKTQEIEAW
jgi:hypothetical protein